jgi:hypothetical protein
MAEKTYRYYKDLPTWAKGAVIVGGVAITGYLLIKIYNSIKANADKRDSLEFSKNAQSELNSLKMRGIKPSYSATQYQGFASKLVIALDGCGSDEEAVFGVFENMNNKADVLNLISAFGVRYYQPCAATSPIAYGRWVIDSKTYGGNLSSWLSYDLTQSELKKINAILTTKGIDYKF